MVATQSIPESLWSQWERVNALPKELRRAALTVGIGESMEPPELRSWTWVLCEWVESYGGPAIYAIRSPDGLQVKRLQRTNGDMRILGSNSAYPPVEVDMGEFEKHYKVIARVALVERRV